jgi:competence protein ComEA
MAVDVRRRVAYLLDSLADRLGIAPVTLVVGAAAVAAAAFAGWWAFATPTPPPVEQVLPRIDTVDGAPASDPVGVAGTVDEPADPTTIVVHVDGAVRRPGVHELPVGARVIDAIDAADGLTDEADRARLNLAAPLGDGQRVWVPTVGEDEPPIVGPDGGGTVAGTEEDDGPIDLNRADQSALETLPGVGPSIAGAIIEHRTREGPFVRVEDLLEVSGIGPARLAQLEPLVTV